MRKAISAVVLLGLASFAAAQEKRPATAQSTRGRELFLKSPKGTACAACHSMDGVGTSVSPDLTRMASLATAHSMGMTIKMTMTNEVQLVKTAKGKFPGILKQKQSMERDVVWRHPPALADYNAHDYNAH